MPEQTIKDTDKTFIENDGHRRFKESVDTTKTPEEELNEAKRRYGSVGRPDANTK
jgi:hypothetical protein